MHSRLEVALFSSYLLGCRPYDDSASFFEIIIYPAPFI